MESEEKKREVIVRVERIRSELEAMRRQLRSKNESSGVWVD
jgi:hypothetical protein